MRWQPVLDELGAQHVGVHVRGAWGSGTGREDGIAFADVTGQAAYVDVARLTPEDDADARGVAGGPATNEGDARHEGARCWPSRRTGGRWRGLVSDTALAAYLARPDQRSYDLADLTLRYLAAS